MDCVEVTSDYINSTVKSVEESIWSRKYLMNTAIKRLKSLFKN